MDVALVMNVMIEASEMLRFVCPVLNSVHITNLFFNYKHRNCRFLSDAKFDLVHNTFINFYL